MTEQASHERWVKSTEGSAAWAAAAREILIDVASRHLGVITYADLAEQVQSRTGLRNRSPYRSWIGGVLAIVVAGCRADGLPPLTSLVSHRPDGGTGLDESTTLARFACYRRFAVDIPAEAIAEADAAARARAATTEEAQKEQRVRRSAPRSSARDATPRPRRQAIAEEAPKICPTCFMQLPASGVCENCS